LTIPDNGSPEKKFVFLVVDYRPLNGARESVSGLSNEFSSKGLTIETQSSDIAPGDNLELVLKDPHKDSSVTVSGGVISKKDGWYKSVIEVGFKGLTTETETELLNLISGLDDNSDAGLLPDSRESMEEKQVEVKTEFQLSDKEYLAEAVAEMPVSSDRKTRDAEAGPQKVETTGPIKKKKRAWPRVIILLAVLSILAVTGSRYFHDIEKMIIKPGPAASIEIVEMPAPVPDALGPDEIFQAVDHREAVDVETGFADAPVKAGELVDTAVFDTLIENTENGNAAVQETPKIALPLPVEEKKENISIAAEITFGTDSDVVSPDFYPEIDRIANASAVQAGTVVKIEGHTDDVGPEIYNIDLSLRRALAVKKLLNQRGIGKHQIKIEVLGDADPVTSNDTVSGRSKNRRVVIKTIPLDT